MLPLLIVYVLFYRTFLSLYTENKKKYVFVFFYLCLFCLCKYTSLEFFKIRFYIKNKLISDSFGHLFLYLTNFILMSTIKVHSLVARPIRALSCCNAKFRFIKVNKKRCSLPSSYKLCNTYQLLLSLLC